MPNAFDQLLAQARTRPDSVALWQCRRGAVPLATTYSKLAQTAQTYARAFSRLLLPGQIIPLVLPKSASCIAAMYGAIGAGSAFASLYRKLKLAQIQQILSSIERAWKRQQSTASDNAHPTLMLVDGIGLQTIDNGLRAQQPADANDNPLPGTRICLIRDEAFQAPQQAAFDRLTQRGLEIIPWPATKTPDPFDGDCIPNPKSKVQNPKSVGCCLFTSGSTGTPKGVLIAEADLRARAQAEAACFGITPDDVLLNVLPFSFDVGLSQLMTAISTGCSLVLLDSFLPTDVLKAAAEFHITGISGVPSIWQDMMNAKLAFDTAGPHKALRYITVSGGDLPAQYLERLPSITGSAGIIKTYGQSEAFRSCALTSADFAARPEKRRSVGRPFGSSRVYTIHEDLTPCAANESGEIVHSGLGAMIGYLDGPTLLASDGSEIPAKLRPNPFHGESDPNPMAIFTGDMGYLDEDGYLYVQGRRDAMLKVSGNRVYPAEIATQIISTGLVGEAEVIGIKREGGDTEIIAFVVPSCQPATGNPQPATPDETDLRRTLADRLPTYMVPRRIVLCAAFPRTASGKVDRPALLLQLENSNAH